jgi:hypothetical protein
MNINTINTYDKSNNLIGFVEFNSENQLKSYYKINGNTLNRKFTNEYEFGEKEVVSSVLEYKDSIMLFPLQVYGETSMRVIQSSSTISLTTVDVVKRLDSYFDSEENNHSIETFTIKSNLIEDWINKL